MDGLLAGAGDMFSSGCDVPLFAHSMIQQMLAWLLPTGHWLW